MSIKTARPGTCWEWWYKTAPGGRGLCLSVITVASLYWAFTLCPTFCFPCVMSCRLPSPPSEEGTFCPLPLSWGEKLGLVGRVAGARLLGGRLPLLEVAVPPGAACRDPSTSVLGWRVTPDCAASCTAVRARSLLPAGLLGWLVGRNEWEVALLKPGATRPRFGSWLPSLLTVRPSPAEPALPGL